MIRKTQLATAASLAALVVGLLAAHPAAAGEVVMFDGTAPQAAALARILWPSKHAAGEPGAAGATRSIRISAEPTAAAAATMTAPAPVQVAAAEPAPAAAAAPAPAADAFGFRIQFAFDSAEVLPQSRPYLDSVGQMLKLPQAQGRRVAIVGHTDATGSADYNQSLSERRAAAVRAYLESRFGIAADQLAIIGEGMSEPLPGQDPRSAANRRVEFHAAG